MRLLHFDYHFSSVFITCPDTLMLRCGIRVFSVKYLESARRKSRSRTLSEANAERQPKVLNIRRIYLPRHNYDSWLQTLSFDGCSSQRQCTISIGLLSIAELA